MAGESAREVARRSRERAERLQRRAEMFERGAEGEEATAAALTGLPTGWSTIHDVHWPNRRLANIDHVVIGPGGVFVIDSKNWSGKLTAAAGILRQNGRSREKYVASGADAALAIAELVAPYLADYVVPVLCFVGQTEVEGWCRDVMVCSTDNLTRMLLTRPFAMSPDQSTDAWFRLDSQLRSAVEPPAALPVRSAGVRVRTQPPVRRAPTRGHTRAGRRSNSVLKLLVSIIALVAFVTVGPAVATSIGQVVSGVLTHGLTPSGACVVEASPSPSGAALAPGKRTREAPAQRRKRSADAAVNKRSKSQASQTPTAAEPSPGGTSESC